MPGVEYGTRRVGELLLVPVEMVPRVWRSARSLFYGWDKGNGSKGAPPGYDIKRAHARLTVGVDRLWIAAMIRAKGRVWDDPEGMQHRFYGAVITSVRL